MSTPLFDCCIRCETKSSMSCLAWGLRTNMARKKIETIINGKIAH